MPRRFWLPALLAMVTIVSSVLARAQYQVPSDDERYTIMRPEPWLAPTYKSPRGTKQHVTVPQPRAQVAPKVAPKVAPQAPPPILVPQTGRLLPNLPTISGAGPGGAETSQDRAVRCAHQAGVYGQAAGDRNAYIGACINQ